MSLLSPDENGEGSLAAGGSGKQHRGGACMGGGESARSGPHLPVR